VSGPVGTTVFVEAHARLHFGVLDLRGSLGRWFGGIGAAAPAPLVRLSARPSDRLTAEGADAERALVFAQRFLTHHRLDSGAHIVIEQALPPHSGLGSGTQLALAVGRALADLNAMAVDPVALSLAVGRAKRSAIGTWLFSGGGLVVEGGRARDSEGCGPLISRIELPPQWHCVVAIPTGQTGISGQAESHAFATLAEPPQQEVEHVAHLVLMALLPAAADGDLPAFGRALTEIQQMNGRWFAAVQGDTFAPGIPRTLINVMLAAGAAGAGQSSWGPAVYGIVDSRNAAELLATRVSDALGSRGVVHYGPFPAHGARVWRNATR
jgi:beta-ribofuranosylaminobenzene 5'-phosphate synthase